LAYGPAVKNGLPDRTTMDSYVRPLRESAGVRRDVRRFLRAVDSRYTMDAAETLESFGKPVLLAWAGDDLLFPLEHPPLLAAPPARRAPARRPPAERSRSRR